MPDRNNDIRIALLTALDPFDRRAWSGSMYYLMQAAQRQCGDVTPLGPAPHGQFWGRVLNQLSRRTLYRGYDYLMSVATARHYAREFERKLAQGSYDVILAADACAEIAYLETELPIVYYAAATVPILLGYYPEFQRLLPNSVRQMQLVHTRAIQRADRLIFSSQWAADSAIRDTGADRAHVSVVPFGANIEAAPSRESALQRQMGETCRLLFPGKFWDRKGGDIALEALITLEKRGIPAELTVVGCTPPPGVSHPRMRVLGYLNKRIESERRQLETLFDDYDLLLLPTRADCTPVVFNEANAHGMPVISTDTGGIASIITHGENGLLLPLSASGGAYAHRIAELFHDKCRYQALVAGSRCAYERRLNWDAWGQSVKLIMDELLLERAGGKTAV